MGVGEAVADKKIMDAAVGDMAKITGQKPVICQGQEVRSRRSSCATAWPIGCKVTLRGARMYEFLDRLISDRDAAHPRLPRRVSARSFDGRGNYNLGVKEQIIFPEIQYDQIDQIRGMDITITTTARGRQAGPGAAGSIQFSVPQVSGSDGRQWPRPT